MRPTPLRFLLLALAAVVLAATTGCKPMGSAAPAGAYDEYSEYGDHGGYRGYEDEEYAAYDMKEADSPVIAESLSTRSAGGARAERKTKAKMGKGARNESPEPSMMPGPEAEPAPDSTTENGAQLEAPEDDSTEADSGSERQIIYTATMVVQVYDLEASTAWVESIPARYGGWMHQRVDTQFVLRVPAEHLEVIMDAIAELGVVDQRLLEALDVTAEYTDLESRIRVLTEMQAHLSALLAKAKSVEQALEIRRVLDQVTMELELARAHMRELSKSIAFSTLILRLDQRGPAEQLPESNDPFLWVDELGVEITEYR